LAAMLGVLVVDRSGCSGVGWVLLLALDLAMTALTIV
jgi:hypothetical protein